MASDLSVPENVLEIRARVRDARRFIVEIERDGRILTIGWTRSLRYLPAKDESGPGCLIDTGHDHRIGTQDDLQLGCDLDVLNPHLLADAALKCATDRLDAWGNDVFLRARSVLIEAWSAGPDGKVDTADDRVAVALNPECGRRFAKK
jgi:hypothetical protein